MKTLDQITAQQLRRAADIKEQIDGLKSELGDVLQITVTVAEDTAPRIQATVKRRRRMSPVVRARLADVARARWRAARRNGKNTL